MLGFKWNPTYIGMNAAPITARQIIDGVILFVTLRMRHREHRLLPRDAGVRRGAVAARAG